MVYTKNNARSMKFMIFLLLVLFFGIFAYVFDIQRFLSVTEIRSMVEDAGIYGPIIFIGLYAFSAIAFLPATPFTLAAGVVFDPLTAICLVVLGANLGAIMSFSIARVLGESFVKKLVHEKFHVLDTWNEQIRAHGLSVVLLLRIIPVFPFSPLNYLLGLTEVRFTQYVLGTVIGILPATTAYVLLGGSVGSMNIVQFFLAVFVLCILIAIGFIYKKVTQKLSPQSYDIIVVGAGAAGLNIAQFFNTIGAKVLLIDKKRESFGGDCLNFGCVPSKALIHVARLFGNVSNVSAFTHETIQKPKADMAKIRAYIDAKKNVFRVHESPEYFRTLGMDVAIGTASFCGRNSVMVQGKKYTGKKIVLATGSRPRKFVCKNSNLANILTNEDIFSLETLPDQLLVIGGGPIGIELACAFALLGSSVTIIEQGPRILAREDADIVAVLMKKCASLGITIITDVKITQFIDAHTIELQHTDSTMQTIAFDTVLAAVGREIDVKNIKPERANISVTENKFVVNDKLQTTNPDVYVCGDSAGAAQFTHVAELHAALVIQNIISPIKKSVHTNDIGWVTYTDPEIATFGYAEATLKEKNIFYEVFSSDFSDDDRAITDDYAGNALVKLFVSKKGYILGGTMIAPHAGELIQELLLAKKLSIPLAQLFKKNYPYPTATRINRRLVSRYMSQTLTDFRKKVLYFVFKIHR